MNRHIDLSCNASLKHLHLDLICVVPAFNASFSWIPALLAQGLKVPSLEEVKIFIVFKHDVSSLDGFPWEDVERVLAKLPLRRVSWAFLVTSPLQVEAEKYVRVKLKVLQTRGVLNFIRIY